MKLFESIQKAVKCKKLDDAILIVQNSIGQNDGFNASIYFSDGLDDYDWIGLNEYDRAEILARYVSYEIRNSFTEL